MVLQRQRQHLWWVSGVFYQTCPRWFQDSDTGGVGDLAGIESRLDYLAGLGIDAIWFPPINLLQSSNGLLLDVMVELTS